MSMSLNHPGREWGTSTVKVPKWKLAVNIFLPVVLILGLCLIFKGIDSCPTAEPVDYAQTTISPNIGARGQTLSIKMRDTNAQNHGVILEDKLQSVSFGPGITVNNLVKHPPYELVVNISISDGAALGSRDIVVVFTDGATGGYSIPDSFTVTRNPLVEELLEGENGAPSGSSSVPGATTTTQPVALANIQTQSASLSAKAVTPGTPVTVTADIINRSTVNGNKKVTLYVNGQVETTQGVTVNSGGSSKLTFNVSRSEPGDYAVYVDGVPAGSFKVELFRESDGILILSASLVSIAFIAGMVMLWRRQQRGN